MRTLAALLFLVGCGVVSGQTLPDAETKEVLSFSLTEAGFAKYVRASDNLLPVMEQMPRDCGDEDGPRSLDALVARLDAAPGVKAAIRSAGMTTREYVVFSWSLLTSGIAAWGLDQPGAKLPPGMSRANVDFVKKHQPEIDKLEVLRKFGDCDE